MHSKRRSSVIHVLETLETFRNYKGFSVIFPKTLAAIESFMKVKIFLIPLCIVFSIPSILGFLFLRKKKLNLGSEMGKIKLKNL